MLQSRSSFGVQMRCSNFLLGVRAFKGNTALHPLQFTALLMSRDLAEIGLLHCSEDFPRWANNHISDRKKQQDHLNDRNNCELLHLCILLYCLALIGYAHDAHYSNSS